MAATTTPVSYSRAYLPYAGDYASYGYGPEHVFFGGTQYGTPPAVVPPPPGTTTPPPGTGTPGSSGPPGGVPQGTGSGSGTGVGGNEGGASHGVGGGGAGDNAGHPGTDSQGNSRGLAAADDTAQAPMAPGGVDYPTLPGWLDAITSAASVLLPMPYSLPFTAGRLGLKAYDMFGATNPNRESLGLDRLSALQALGGFVGSPYGNLQNPEVASAEDMKGQIPAGWGETGVTANGGPMPGWQLGPFQIGGGQGTLSYANDRPGLPGSSAIDQHQIVLAQQQAASGTLPSFSPQPTGWNFGLDRAPAASSSAPPAYASSTGAPSGPAIVSGNDAPAPTKKPSGGPTYQGVAITSYGRNGEFTLADGRTVGGGFNGPGATGGVSQGSFNMNDNSYDAETARDVADSRAAADAGDVGDFRLRRGGLASAGPLSIRRSLHPRGLASAARSPTMPAQHRLLPAGAPNPEPSTGIAALARGGFVHSKSAGRADSVKTKVPADTYIMPADVVAALGQGNSLHGAHVLDHTVRRLHARPQLAGSGRLPRNPKPSVDVALSGGEYRIPPSAVAAIGRGSVDAGAGHLDRLVVGLRHKFAQHLHTLPPPRK